jgi:hypothetical protein
LTSLIWKIILTFSFSQKALSNELSGQNHFIRKNSLNIAKGSQPGNRGGIRLPAMTNRRWVQIRRFDCAAFPFCPRKPRRQSSLKMFLFGTALNA